MRLLDRYLMRELLTPLAYCLGGFLIFWISYDLFTELNEMQERKLHLPDVIGYSIAMTPEFLVMVLPIALLLAAVRERVKQREQQRGTTKSPPCARRA